MQPLKFASDANGRDALPRVRGGMSKNRRNAKPKNAALFAYHPGRTGAHLYHGAEAHRQWPNSIGEILEKVLKTFSLRIHRYVGEETSLIFQ
jgi:hypothetical protein